MSGIKYYQLAEGEELPDEFCAVKNVGGEPTEYTFYRQEAENAALERRIDELCVEVDCLEGKMKHARGQCPHEQRLCIG